MILNIVTNNDYSISVQQQSSPPSNFSTKSSNCDRMLLKLYHPQKSIVASLGNGRLGNQMSNFASGYAIMKEYGMYPYLGSNQLKSLRKVFLLPEHANHDNASFFLWEEGKFYFGSNQILKLFKKIYISKTYINICNFLFLL